MELLTGSRKWNPLYWEIQTDCLPASITKLWRHWSVSNSFWSRAMTPNTQLRTLEQNDIQGVNKWFGQSNLQIIVIKQYHCQICCKFQEKFYGVMSTYCPFLMCLLYRLVLHRNFTQKFNLHLLHIIYIIME